MFSQQSICICLCIGVIVLGLKYTNDNIYIIKPLLYITYIIGPCLFCDIIIMKMYNILDTSVRVCIIIVNFIHQLCKIINPTPIIFLGGLFYLYTTNIKYIDLIY